MSTPVPVPPATMLPPGTAPGWIDSMLAAGVDDAGFAALIARAFADARRPPQQATVAALLEGNGSTSKLPVDAAVAVVERVATIDVDAAAAIVSGDRRRAVADAFTRGVAAAAAEEADRTRRPGDVDGALAGVAAELELLYGSWSSAHWDDDPVVAVVSALPPAVAADLFVAVVAGDLPFALHRAQHPAPELAAAGRLAVVLRSGTEVTRVADALGRSVRFADAPPSVRAIVTYACFAAGEPDGVGGCFSGTRDDVLAAHELSRRRLPPGAASEMRSQFSSTARVAMLAWLAADAPAWIEGPGSVADAVGISSLAAASTDQVWDLCAALASSELTPPEALAAVVTAATAGGRKFRRVPISALRACGDLLDADVCFAVACVADSSMASQVVRRWFLTYPAQRWGPERFAAAFDEHPFQTVAILTELVDMCLDGALDPPPQCWVSESMRRVGLEYWVRRHPGTAAELAAAAAGIGAGRWAAVVSLLGSFRGTPAELIEVTAELTPSATLAHPA